MLRLSSALLLLSLGAAGVMVVERDPLVGVGIVMLTVGVGELRRYYDKKGGKS